MAKTSLTESHQLQQKHHSAGYSLPGLYFQDVGWFETESTALTALTAPVILLHFDSSSFLHSSERPPFLRDIP